MSDSGDSRTSTSLLHYVTPDAKWQPDMLCKPGFDAICGERVLPLWSAYDHALETRAKCAECEQYACGQEQREARAREQRRAATARVSG